MSSRWEVEAALRGSDLPAAARHVLLTLLSYSHAGSAVIPAEHTPSLTGLARATGLDRRTVERHLNVLEAGGWVTRKRPPVAQARTGARTRYRMSAVGGGTTPPEVGAPVHQVGAQDPHPRGTTPPEVGAPVHEPRGTVPLSSYPEPVLPQQQRGAQVIITTTGCTTEEAAAVLQLIQTEKQPRSLVGLVHRLAQAGELPDWLARVRANGHRANVHDLYAAGWNCHRCYYKNRADADTCRQCSEGTRAQAA